MNPKHWLFDAENHLARELDGEYIILNLKTSDYYTLDGAGALMFRMMLQDRAMTDIESSVAAKYGISERSVRKDILDLAAQLKKKKIVSGCGNNR